MADRIYDGTLRNLKVTNKREKHHWLGHGIYFWENAIECAAEWAIAYGEKNLKKTPSFLKRFNPTKDDLKPAVVGAIIDLRNCLNLLDSAGHKVVQDASRVVVDNIMINSLDESGDWSKLSKTIEDLYRDRPSWNHYLDCLSVNEACIDEKGKSIFDTVRGCFPEGDKLFVGSHILSKTHVQISVRNPDCIIGYFRPKNLNAIFAKLKKERGR